MEFTGGEITQLVDNIIVELICAYYDTNRNENLLLEAFVNHTKNDLALSVEDQKEVINGRETFRKSTAGWDI